MASAAHDGDEEALSFAEALSRTMANVDLSRQKSAEAASLRTQLTSDLSSDLRAVMYGLGVLVAAADGITEKETAVLSSVATFLDLPEHDKERVDEAVKKASSSAAGLTALFEAYTAAHPRRASAAREKHELQAEAQQDIFRLPMLDAAEVSRILGSRSANDRQYAARLRRSGAVLGIRRGNRYDYPRFQFDDRKQRVYPAIKVVGEVLGAGHDPWGVVSWWISPNPRLPAGQPPLKLLGTPKDTEELAALARGIVADVG